MHVPIKYVYTAVCVKRVLIIENNWVVTTPKTLSPTAAVPAWSQHS